MVFDDQAFGRYDVGAVIPEAGAYFYGADDVAGGGVGIAGSFDEAVEGGADGLAPASPEANGVDVSVEAREAGEFVVVDDARAGRPVEEGFVDGFAFRVVADGAFAGVAFGGWGCIAGAVGVRPGCCVHRFSFGAVGAV
jgi:hypothetical protein